MVERKRLSKIQSGTTRPMPANAGKGRPKGSLNKTTTTLKDAILIAATRVGEDGKGRDGLVGYLMMIARREPKSMSMLLARLVPPAVAPDPDTPSAYVIHLDANALKSLPFKDMEKLKQAILSIPSRPTEDGASLIADDPIEVEYERIIR